MNNSASISYIFSSSIILTRTCHQRCGYCSLFREEAPLLAIEDLRLQLNDLSKKGASEVVFLAGETPQEYPHIQIELHRYGFSSFADYLNEVCQMTLEANMMPVLSVGYLDEFNAERFTESGCIVRINLVASSLSKPGQAHEKSRGRNPSAGKASIESLHKAGIPYSVGFIIGIGETPEERLHFIHEIGRLCTADPYLQDVRILPFQPSKDCAMPQRPPLPFEAVEKVVQTAKEAFPVHHISVPPHLFYRYPDLTDSGLNDLGSVPILTGDPAHAEFSVPSFETIKARLEKNNLVLFERGSNCTPAAINRPEIAQALQFTRHLIDRRNSSGLNLVDNDHCFVCGTRNQAGLHIPMKDSVKDNTCTFTWTPGPTFQGYAGIVHGGILSTLMDEAMAYAVMNNQISAVTADIRVRFHRPTPVGIPLKFVATRVGQRKNLHFARASVILPDGTVLAEAEGRFAEI
jgi:7,8-didemethyl-8-hydroxy-5-deazariboflavin synthase CofG subunit